MIDSVERKSAGNGGQIILKCKDFLIFQLEVIGIEDWSNAADTLEFLSRVDQTAYLFPFFNRESFEIEEDGWSLYPIEKQLERLPADEWRISDVNVDFQVCPTYPEKVIVPKLVEDDSIKTIGAFRRSGRFPVLSYFHEKNGAVLMRSSQPMVGPNSKRCKEDERMINAVLGQGKRGYIIETRAPNLAQLAKTKGGGFEPEAHYPLWKRVHKPINRHSTLLDSLSKLLEACNDSSSSMDKWLSRVESSGWLSQVQSVLGCACLVAQCISEEGASVLVHGAEGIDSTLQVCSLAQVILDPRSRTVLGFEELIEQEWLQAGHPFGIRCKRGAYASNNSRTRDQSPIFLLFLDCVYQIYYQFPCSFEFNEDFLALLFKHACASQFGTFLGDSVKERKELDIPKKTVSFWSYLNRASIIQEYINPAFEPNSNVIWPSVAPQSIVSIKFRPFRCLKVLLGSLEWTVSQMDRRPKNGSRQENRDRPLEKLRRGNETKSSTTENVSRCNRSFLLQFSTDTFTENSSKSSRRMKKEPHKIFKSL